MANVKDGDFYCVKCKADTFYGCNRWTNREEYDDNQNKVKKWILFWQGSGKFTFCISGLYCNCLKYILKCEYLRSENKLNYILILISISIWFYFVFFYILIFFWIDLIYCCCCSKRKTKTLDLNGNFGEFQDIKNIDDLWKFNNNGYTKEQLDRCLGTKCSRCKYEFQSFTDLIKDKEVIIIQDHQRNNTTLSHMTNSYSNSSGNVISSPSELGLAGDKIAVHFKSIDQNVDQALACDLNEIFLNVENRLKNICDEIKNKN